MDPNGVWEASEKTFVFIVGLHEEVEVFFGLEKKEAKKQEKINGKGKRLQYSSKNLKWYQKHQS